MKFIAEELHDGTFNCYLDQGQGYQLTLAKNAPSLEECKRIALAYKNYRTGTKVLKTHTWEE